MLPGELIRYGVLGNFSLTPTWMHGAFLAETGNEPSGLGVERNQPPLLVPRGCWRRVLSPAQ